jgi:multidrug efflux pump subunit AcrA (membrane-fusion protein)
MTYLLLFLSIGLATALALTIKQLQHLKKERVVDRQKLQEADKRLQKADLKYGGMISREDSVKELDTQIAVLNNQLQQLNRQVQSEEQELSSKISVLKTRLQGLEEQEIVEAFGFYESKYNFQDTQDYKQRLDRIRAQQKQLIKSKKAAICNTEWSVEGSLQKGKKMTDDFIKLVLRAFNGECDASIVKVKYNNIKTMENRIKKAYGDLNKLSQTTRCEITSSFLNLKLQELWLTHEYQEKKYQELEEQRIIREQMREEEKALREIEIAKQDAEKEERRYQEALEKARRDVETLTGKAQEELFIKIEELQQRLAEAEANKERAISQAQLTKSGHVYIISNIGSFGEDVYKIGMTRRLEPMDRVKELGSASVPFPFDVHAMIFCENAPELESMLHRYLGDRRMNKENTRKEFFQVSLDEIVKTVRQIDEELKICKSEIIVTKIAEASDYRKTLARERQSNIDCN